MVEMVGAVPMCPPVSLHKGASVVHSLAHDACVLLWKRRCADVWAGTQAPPLWFRLDGVGWCGVNCAPRFRCPRRPSRA